MRSYRHLWRLSNQPLLPLIIALSSTNALALEAIDPTGAAYTNVSESSRFAATWGATNLFSYDVTGVLPGDVLGTTGEYAKSGGGTAYVAFEVDNVYDVGSIFYAQRFGSTTGDNMQRMSVWTSATIPFTAADPATPPATVFALLPNTGAPKWEEYILTNTIAGKYFLLKLEQTTVTGNPGGNEFRLGLAPTIPVVAVEPVSQTVYSGSTATISVKAAGVGTLYYQWQSSPTGAGTFTDVGDGGKISGANTAALALTDVAPGTTDYRVVVTNLNGTAMSATATLTVTTSQPFIFSDILPAALQQPAGYAFSFTVSVDGSRPLTYQWKRNGVDLANDTRTSGANSNVLTIANATNTDVGNYQLFITNAYGFASSSEAAVTIIPSLPVLDPTGLIYTDISDSSRFNASFISSNLFKQNVTDLKPGSTITGSEYAKSGPGTAYVAFKVDTAYTIGSIFYAQRNGSGTGDNMQKVTIWARTNAAYIAADPGVAGLATINLLPNSGTPVWREYFLSTNIIGQYFLLKLEQTTVTGNPGGNEFRLGLAQESPLIGNSPGDVAAFDGNTVEFTVTANGAQPLRYRWQVSPVGAGTFASLSDSANVSGSTNATLVLRNIPLADFDYRVVVTNNFGSATSAPARLTVSSSVPQIVTDLSPAALQQPAGFAFTYSVQAIGSGPLVYQWTRNGSPLQDNARIAGSRSNVLYIANAQVGDEGTYTVTVTNSYGATPSSDSVLTLAMSFGINDGSAWQLNGGASVASEVLSITEAVNSQARTAFFRVPLSISAFLAEFTYQNLTAGGGDGVGFVVQNSSTGPAALGPGGGGFGYYGIELSAAVLFNAYSGGPGGRGITVMTNGMTPQFAGTTFTSTAPVGLASGNPITISLRYATGNLMIKMVDTVTTDSFVTNITINLPAAVDGTNAYIGFSGATGGVTAEQRISNVSFVNLVPLSFESSAGNLIMSWPVGPTPLVLQYCTDLGAPAWQLETAPASEVNGVKTVTVPMNGDTKFYTLTKQ